MFVQEHVKNVHARAKIANDFARTFKKHLRKTSRSVVVWILRQTKPMATLCNPCYTRILITFPVFLSSSFSNYEMHHLISNF